MAKLPSGRIGRVLSLSDLRQTEGLGRRLRRPAMSFGDQAFCSICNFLTTVLLARMLGLEGFGLYAMIWLPIYLAMSLQLGLIVSPMMSIGGKLSKGEAESYFGTVLLHELAFLAVSAVAIGGVAAALSLSDPRFSGTVLPAAAMAAAYLAPGFPAPPALRPRSSGLGSGDRPHQPGRQARRADAPRAMVVRRSGRRAVDRRGGGSCLRPPRPGACRPDCLASTWLHRDDGEAVALGTMAGAHGMRAMDPGL